MLDIKFIRQHAETVQRVADQKGISVSISDLLDLDHRRLKLLKETETLRAARNERTKEIALLMRQDASKEPESLKNEVKQINVQLNHLERALTEVNTAYHQMMMLVPNIVSPDTPVGKSDADNVEIKRVGVPPAFNFEPKDHVKLGELHDMIDIPRGVKVGGSRSYFLKGAGFQLHRAVQQLAIDLLISRGFIPMDVPTMVRQEALWNTGFFPTGQDQTYKFEDEPNWLVGTSEVSLMSYYSQEIVDVSEPIRLAGVSSCFRREVGSAGRDVHGLYRVHQFAKVEQVILCENNADVSEQILQQITQNAEDILQMLELPYRVMAVCTGDMSQKTYKQYDIETWMPSRNGYGETHSSSNLHDFQARRSNIRYRGEDGNLHYCHTLNNTAVATPRILIPLLENHQQEDGSIYIPQALRKYLGGAERLG
ncbi:serine--tRNA ligase [Paenibacillus sediminis]|uniref:Serine--tRNA ligase n=1 Tax=Paenibacillus sediminis TaxID=664909 RepID=A0ABS4H2Y6_9BACL|nr:serine--tRNA ligase [Paenibacillus sediminis]MBP1936886.1 seryl-tRNA synthetase [Paenibacillus sediminis]